ncbi:TonB-dependent receptor [Porphyrobacter sp. TH134]|uniref:TonB-dependent receptor n=1 Tax=Porphyrobacter sp. TH134 TaxID=2067450 RepID=UPI000C7A85D7|nr:TonB-dependent receptor [Porphyrobacter sp. TH134]PLK22396.1 TonB-dependent receptor [Porphyrobacter sp. TH134]
MLKSVWLLSVSALVLVPAPAIAQSGSADELAAAPPREREQEIVVTGFRKGELEAVEAKRDAFIVSDSVVSDDIGRLPDQNTAAALRRIPGISVQEDQNEPRFPSIRGLPPTYNRTQINGAIVATGDNGGSRTVPLDTVPSNFAQRLEVYKTITPEMDPNAIGGIINIVTRSAFDSEKPFFNATAAYTLLEQANDIASERTSWRATAQAGSRFGPDRQFGIVGQANYSLRNYDITQFETATPSFREYTAAGAPVDLGQGNGIPVPVQERLFLYNNVRERIGGALALEWQPGPSVYMRLFGTYNRFKDNETRDENRLEPVGNVTNQTATTGTFASARNVINLNLPTTSQEIWNLQYNARFEASEQLRVDIDAIYSGAQGKEVGRGETFRSASSAAFAFDYDASDFFFEFAPRTPASLANPALHPFLNRTESLNTTQQDIYEGRLNLTYDSAFGDTEIELKTGGIFRRTDHVRNQDQTTYTLTPGSGVTYTLADAFVRKPLDVIGGKVFDLAIDRDQALAFFNANRSAFTAATNNVNGDFTVTEDVYGGFLQARIKAGDIEALGGLRYERTDVNSASVRVNGGVTTPSVADGGFDSFLPSVHLRWNAGPDLVVRAAWANTIGRANFGDVTARETLNIVAGAIPTLSRGNPSLQPREAMGLDLSAEYYTGNGGLLSLGVFYKDIKNEIFTLTSIETIDLGIGRGAEQVEVSQPDNAQSATIFGIEAAVQQSLTFLPAPFDGLGINLNGTYVDSDLEVLTTAGPRKLGFFLQPTWAANASLFYEKGRFEARLAYNYTGGFLETINQTIPGADQFWKSRETVDAQIRFRLTPNIDLFVEGENLTDSQRIELTGPNRNLLQESAQYGRTFSFGASVVM